LHQQIGVVIKKRICVKETDWRQKSGFRETKKLCQVLAPSSADVNPGFPIRELFLAMPLNAGLPVASCKTGEEHLLFKY